MSHFNLLLSDLPDSRSVNLKNTRGNIQRKAGKALYNVAESLPGDWQTFSDNNIRCVMWSSSFILKEELVSSFMKEHSFFLPFVFINIFIILP